jgi:hypothetical protein
MTKHLRTLSAGVLLAYGALATSVAVAHDDGDDETTPPRNGPYVALGGSCTAGPKIPTGPAAPPAATAPPATTRRWSPANSASPRPASAT